MRILVVNDDGIRSPGIIHLARMAARLGEVWVVAPQEQCSGMSQRLTLFDEMPVRDEDFPAPVYAAFGVGGTPADCVKLALDSLMAARPDYVFSGVNDGWNAGFDLAYSGTFGACLEAVMNGVPAIAFSAKGKAELDVALAWMQPLAEELIAAGQEPGEIWNVNFPAGPLSELRGVLRDRRVAPMQLYNGVFSWRTELDGARLFRQTGVPIGPGDAPEGSDIAAVLDGYISVGKVKSALF